MQENNRRIIIVPDMVMPKRDLVHPCPCQDIPVKLVYKKGKIISWLKRIGEKVELNEVICEGEVEKKSVEFVSPCQGRLTEQRVVTGDVFEAGTILGYIEELA
jgi:hypothetical protein